MGKCNDCEIRKLVLDFLIVKTKQRQNDLIAKREDLELERIIYESATKLRPQMKPLPRRDML